MLKNSRVKIGSLHVVIPIVIVALILIALGYVAWSNFISPVLNESTDNGVQTSTTSDNAKNILKVSTDDTFPKKLTIEYPDDWTANVTGGGPEVAGQMATQDITIYITFGFLYCSVESWC